MNPSPLRLTRTLCSLACLLALASLLVPPAGAQEGRWEVTVSIVLPDVGEIPVACDCFDFEADGCMLSDTGLLALWASSNLDLDPVLDEFHATTGPTLPKECGGRTVGFEGIGLHGTVDELNGTIEFEGIKEFGDEFVFRGFENDRSLSSCQIAGLQAP